MKTSKTYNDLKSKIDAYENACAAYEAEKEANRAAMSDDDFWAWYGKHAKPEYPLTGGQNKAMYLVYWNEAEELVYDDFVWEKEAHDFITTLRDMGAKTIVITNQSTALMENMHWFQQEGCKLVGLCEVETGKKDWLTHEPERKMGVRFEF